MKLEGVSAALNAGQAVVLAVGLTAVLVAATTSGAGLTPGDLVRAVLCIGPDHLLAVLAVRIWKSRMVLAWGVQLLSRGRL